MTSMGKKPERIVLVVRHAKAEPIEDASSDHARKLTGKGVRQTVEGREWLAQQSFTVQQWWASDAARTMQTAWELVGDRTLEVQPKPDLYEASAHNFINHIAEAPDDCDVLAVVGHQPAVSSVVAVLTGRHLDYPPCTIVAVGIDGSWSDLEAGKGRVLETFRP